MATSRTFEAFERRMRARADEVLKSSEATVKRIVSAGASSLAQITPVDTGNAVRNWEVIFGTAPEVSDPSRDRPKDPAALAVLRGSAGAAKTESALKMLGKIQKWNFSLGNILSLSNQTPYIILLEHGSSSQAPSGMTKRSILVMKDRAKREKVVLRRE